MSIRYTVYQANDCFVVIQNLDLILADIDLLDQNILQLLEYWDKNDLLKHDGTFNKPTRAEILK